MARQTWDFDASWQNYAACRGENPDWFFAPNHLENKDERHAREARAKATCARCPVRQACLAFAIATREPHGVWGGMNETERRNVISKRAG
ncbi:MAG TPA: WhiB family transcriptional regulator [Actinomycetota bacterium]